MNYHILRILCVLERGIFVMFVVLASHIGSISLKIIKEMALLCRKNT